MTLAHFDDLTKINVPFGLLDSDTQGRLQASDGPFQRYGNGDWNAAPDPSWSDHAAYRIAPAPVVSAQTCEVQVALFGRGIDPLFSTRGQTGDGWTNGEMFIKSVDGKPVSATWEAYP